MLRGIADGIEAKPERSDGPRAAPPTAQLAGQPAKPRYYELLEALDAGGLDPATAVEVGLERIAEWRKQIDELHERIAGQPEPEPWDVDAVWNAIVAVHVRWGGSPAYGESVMGTEIRAALSRFAPVAEVAELREQLADAEHRVEAVVQGEFMYVGKSEWERYKAEVADLRQRCDRQLATITERNAELSEAERLAEELSFRIADLERQLAERKLREAAERPKLERWRERAWSAYWLAREQGEDEHGAFFAAMHRVGLPSSPPTPRQAAREIVAKKVLGDALTKKEWDTIRAALDSEEGRYDAK
jgi:hypothetical protein